MHLDLSRTHFDLLIVESELIHCSLYRTVKTRKCSRKKKRRRRRRGKTVETRGLVWKIFAMVSLSFCKR